MIDNNSNVRIGAIVLAAGRSERMKQPKMLLEWFGHSIIQHVVSTLSATHLQPIVVVTGAWHNEISANLHGFPVQIVFNPEWVTGMLSSVQHGIKALPNTLQGAVITLSDHPAITPETVNKLVSAHRRNITQIILPRYAGKTGHPVIIPHMFWPELDTLDPNVGLNQLMQRHPDALSYVEMETDEILIDVDTMEDYISAIKRQYDPKSL